MTEIGEIGQSDPLKRRRLGRRGYRSPGGFKMVELNAVGWSALIGVGMAAGTVVSIATRASMPGSLVAGVLGTWGAVLALDHQRWRNSTASTSRGDLDKQAYLAAIDRLRAMGIGAAYREFIDDETGDVQGAIECRQADLPAVETMLNGRSLP